MEQISVNIDFTELMECTVDMTDRVLKVIDNIIRLEDRVDHYVSNNEKVINGAMKSFYDCIKK